MYGRPADGFANLPLNLFLFFRWRLDTPTQQVHEKVRD
jgi:hypothetical protein